MITNQGFKITIVEYFNSMDITVRFEDGYEIKNQSYGNFMKGAIARFDRVGHTKINNQGLNMKVIEYNSSTDISVMFDDGNVISGVTYNSFKSGKIENPCVISTCGVGYVGIGEYKTSHHGVATAPYEVWHGMIQRCYDERCIAKHKSYFDCVVCEEWHNFQNFAKWYYNNYYEIKDETIQLDKDILYKGNRIYCPDACIFVPERINKMFVLRADRRGEYPIGVRFNKRTGKFESHIRGEPIKYCATVEEAFNAYKVNKENRIKQVADEYKDKIPKKLYNALYQYVIEITD